MAYKETDDQGRVTFPDLPDGSYRLNIEYPGIPMDPNSFIAFEVGEGGMEENTLTLEATVDELGISVELVEILTVLKDHFESFVLYPNPVSTDLFIEYTKRTSDEIKLVITDLQGKQVSEQLVERGLNQKLTVNMRELPEGIYILRFLDTLRQTQIATHKVLVKRP